MNIDIYTDCSVKKNRYYMGVFITDDNDVEKSYFLRTNMDSLRKEFKINRLIKASSNIGETYAILKSLSLIDRSLVKNIRIFTDNEFSFDLLNENSNPKLIRKFPHYSVIKNQFDKYKSYFNIDVMWIKSHCGVYGNEIADYITGMESNVINSFVDIKYDKFQTKIFECSCGYSLRKDINVLSARCLKCNKKVLDINI